MKATIRAQPCTDGEWGLFPDQDDCTKYWICSPSGNEQGQCPQGMVQNVLNLRRGDIMLPLKMNVLGAKFEPKVKTLKSGNHERCPVYVFHEYVSIQKNNQRKSSGGGVDGVRAMCEGELKAKQRTW